MNINNEKMTDLPNCILYQIISYAFDESFINIIKAFGISDTESKETFPSKEIYQFIFDDNNNQIITPSTYICSIFNNLCNIDKKIMQDINLNDIIKSLDIELNDFKFNDDENKDELDYDKYKLYDTIKEIIIDKEKGIINEENKIGEYYDNIIKKFEVYYSNGYNSFIFSEIIWNCCVINPNTIISKFGLMHYDLYHEEYYNLMLKSLINLFINNCPTMLLYLIKINKNIINMISNRNFAKKFIKWNEEIIQQFLPILDINKIYMSQEHTIDDSIYQRTLLHFVCEYINSNDDELYSKLILLLKNGADPNIINHDNETCIYMLYTHIRLKYNSSLLEGEHISNTRILNTIPYAKLNQLFKLLIDKSNDTQLDLIFHMIILLGDYDALTYFINKNLLNKIDINTLFKNCSDIHMNNHDLINNTGFCFKGGNCDGEACSFNMNSFLVIIHKLITNGYTNYNNDEPYKIIEILIKNGIDIKNRILGFRCLKRESYYEFSAIDLILYFKRDDVMEKIFNWISESDKEYIYDKVFEYSLHLDKKCDEQSCIFCTIEYYHDKKCDEPSGIFR